MLRYTRQEKTTKPANESRMTQSMAIDKIVGWGCEICVLSKVFMSGKSYPVEGV